MATPGAGADAQPQSVPWRRYVLREARAGTPWAARVAGELGLGEFGAQPSEATVDEAEFGAQPSEATVDESRDVLAEMAASGQGTAQGLPPRQWELSPAELEARFRMQARAWRFVRDHGDRCSGPPVSNREARSRSRSRGQKEGKAGMRGWSHSESDDDGKFRLKTAVSVPASSFKRSAGGSSSTQPAEVAQPEIEKQGLEARETKELTKGEGEGEEP